VDESLTDLNGTWERGRKGNLWCRYDDRTLSVFPCGDRYKWCVAGAGGPRYSRGTYPTEAEAAEAAEAQVLEG
jgi:hypothetical protein